MTPIEWAVQEISQALGAAYEGTKDRLKVLLGIRRAIAHTYFSAAKEAV